MLLSKFDTEMKLHGQQKDLRLAVDLADSVDQPLHVTASANEVLALRVTFIYI